MRILRVLLVLGILALPGEAQQAGKVARIGFLIFPPVRPGWAEPFLPTELVRRAIRELGYVEDQHVAWNPRGASNRDFLRQVAADLVKLQAEVIVASGAEAIQAAKDATKTIPIVMLSFADPVGMRFVASLGRPGGNVTGVSLMTADLGEKRLALLKEALPRASRMAVLWNPSDATAASEWRRLQAAAGKLGVGLVSLESRTPEDILAAFANARKRGAAALLVVLDPLTYGQGSRIVELPQRTSCRRCTGRGRLWSGAASWATSRATRRRPGEWRCSWTSLSTLAVSSRLQFSSFPRI